jgi:NAD+ synthase (glutamine-hydrolysing)
MKIVRVGAAALNQTPLDWPNNFKNIVSAIQTARQAEVSVLCLPELCITGYGCEDAFFYREVQEYALKILNDIVEHHSDGIIVSLGLPLAYRNALYNVAALVSNGQLLGFVPKQHLASDGVHYEPRWFKRWPAGYVDTIDRPSNHSVRDDIGDLIFDAGGVRIGFEVCEDAWVADRPGVELAKRGVDIILNPSASHFAFDKHEIRERFVTEGSRAFRCTYVYANLLGNEAGRLIFDGDTLIASHGELLVEGPRLSFKDTTLITADVDVQHTRTLQLQNGAFRPTTAKSCEVVSLFSFAPPTKPHPQEMHEALHPLADKYDEFQQAVALGLFDYMRKSHSDGFVVSLSGGADSAAVACLVAIMQQTGIEQLGINGFLSKLGPSYAPFMVADMDGADSGFSEEIIARLLTCVYQATANSSKVTEKAATVLALGLGATFMNISVEHIVQEYTRIGEQFAKRQLSWEQDDIALQNIQARVRAPGVWMIANIRNALLLATSNRSEAAVGYATMDGDTCGGLSPIAGIDKTFIRRWLARLATTPDYHDILKPVVEQQPTAELRPADRSQTDEKDLMPYEVLNFIEEAAIRDKQGPAEVLERLRQRFGKTIHTAILVRYMKRFFSLWARNQWKRERYAVAFHLDDRNLDPKTWCRFPVLSGGFETEIKELLSGEPKPED